MKRQTLTKDLAHSQARSKEQLVKQVQPESLSESGWPVQLTPKPELKLQLQLEREGEAQGQYFTAKED